MNASEVLEMTKETQLKSIAKLDGLIKIMANEGHRYALLDYVVVDVDLQNRIIKHYTDLGFKAYLNSIGKIEINW